jgi:hypothetical protein
VRRESGSFQRCALAPVASSSLAERVAEAKDSQHSIDCQSLPVIVGTVSGDGRYLATVEKRGKIQVFRTLAFPTGGLDCEEIRAMHKSELTICVGKIPFLPLMLEIKLPRVFGPDLTIS